MMMPMRLPELIESHLALTPNTRTVMILHQLYAFRLTLVELRDIGWPVQFPVIAVHVSLFGVGLAMYKRVEKLMGRGESTYVHAFVISDTAPEASGKIRP